MQDDIRPRFGFRTSRLFSWLKTGFRLEYCRKESNHIFLYEAHKNVDSESVQPGNKILHFLHGPCEVMYVGNHYIGIFIDAQYTGICSIIKLGHYLLIPNNKNDYCLWNDYIDEAWHREGSRMAEIHFYNWPFSTFQVEAKGNQHFTDSHWEPFFENSVDVIKPWVKQLRKAGEPTTGYGGYSQIPHELPDWCPVGETISWPHSKRGIAASYLSGKKSRRFLSLYPFWAEGNTHHLELDFVLE